MGWAQRLPGAPSRLPGAGGAGSRAPTPGGVSRSHVRSCGWRGKECKDFSPLRTRSPATTPLPALSAATVSPRVQQPGDVLRAGRDHGGPSFDLAPGMIQGRLRYAGPGLHWFGTSAERLARRRLGRVLNCVDPFEEAVYICELEHPVDWPWSRDESDR